MNNTLLLQQFALLATAPGGVAKLRELILTLAVQGKLVPQDPADEPASELLKRIRAEKDRLIAEGKIKRDKPLAPIAEGEQPFALPQGWEWVKGRDLFTVVRGVTYQKTDAKDSPAAGLMPLLRANNIQSTVNFDDLVYVPASLISQDQILRSGDYVVCLASGSKNLVGKAAPFRPEIACSFGAFCGAIRPIAGARYFSVYLASPMYREAVSGASAGIGINNLKGSSLLDLDIPLPPLLEQSRIVARVEELMRVCDALEAKGQQQAAHHRQLVQTLLGTLTGADRDPDSATPTQDAWQRVATHFDTLLDRPSAVDALEQTILQLAVRGQLVPQDPTDEPASELLKSIRTEKDRLIAEGKIKRDKPLALIREDEQPFTLPPGWEWVRVGDVVEMLNGYAFKSEWFKSAGTRLLRNVNVGHGSVDWTVPAFIDDKLAADFEPFALSEGDVVLTLDRPIISTGLKLAVLRKDDLPCLLLQRVARLNPYPQALLQAFLVLWMQSEAFMGAIDPGRSNGVPHISTKQVASMVFPIPPLPEQARIVARVAHLRHLCADLRQRLTQSQTTQAALAEALAADVVSGSC